VRVHPRTRRVDEAERELHEAWDRIWTKHELTVLEALIILQSIPQTVLKYALRRERHPEDPDKFADEA
jgi:hypothetical protein